MSSITRTHVSGPAAEAITLAAAKLHLRVDAVDEDAAITRDIVAARRSAEHELGRQIGTQTWRLTLDAFPASELGLGPDVSGIVSVQYVDAAGSTQIIAPSDYTLDSADATRCWLLPAEGKDWPATKDCANAVAVTVTCGLDPVPENVVRWMLLQIGTAYKFREGLASGLQLAELPRRYVDALLDPHRSYRL